MRNRDKVTESIIDQLVGTYTKDSGLMMILREGLTKFNLAQLDALDVILLCQ